MSKIGQVPRKQTQMCMQEVSWGELSGRKGWSWAEGGAERWCSPNRVSEGSWKASRPFRCPR